MAEEWASERDLHVKHTIYADNYQTVVADVYTNEKDANKIAAAPNLVEALEGLTNGWGKEQPCFCLPTWGRREHMDRCLVAKAAIAKAKGEQP